MSYWKINCDNIVDLTHSFDVGVDVSRFSLTIDTVNRITGKAISPNVSTFNLIYVPENWTDAQVNTFESDNPNVWLDPRV